MVLRINFQGSWMNSAKRIMDIRLLLILNRSHKMQMPALGASQDNIYNIVTSAL